MTRFEKMEGYPGEIQGRFNSFITTQFDDSLSVEMQIRSLIKWISSSRDLVNDMVDYINLFIELFDDRLQEEIVGRLNEWLADGTLAQIINNDVFDMKADKTFVDSQIERLDQILGDLKEKDISLENDLSDLKEKDISLENDLSETKNDLETMITKINDRTKHIYQSSELGIMPGDDLSLHLSTLNSLDDGIKVIFDHNVTYRITEGMQFIKSLTLDFNHSKINFERDSSSTGIALRFVGNTKDRTTLVSGIEKGNNWINVSNSSNVEIGDLVFIDSEQSFNSARVYYNKGGTFLVTDIKGHSIKINRPLPYTMTAQATVSIIRPLKPTVLNATIENVGTLERGTQGLQLNQTLHARVENVFSDNFNDCFQIIRSVQPTMENIRSGRSMYSGSAESYGLSIYMTTGANVRNSIFASGRHGLSVTGFTPSYDTYLENSTFDNETDDGLAGMDFHESNFNATVIGCVVYGASLSGNITVIGTSFLRTDNIGKNIGLGRYEEDDQANYVFQGCFFSDNISIRSQTGRQNPNGTNNRIGSIIVENCTTTKLDVLLFPRSSTTIEVRCSLIKISGTNNVYVNLGGHVDSLIMENYVNLHDMSLLTTQVEGVNIANLVMSNIRVTGVTGSLVNVYRIGRLLMDNLQISGTDNTIHFRNGGGSKADCVIRHSSFESLTNGVRLDDMGIVTLDGNVGTVLDPKSTATTIRTTVFE